MIVMYFCRMVYKSVNYTIWILIFHRLKYVTVNIFQYLIAAKFHMANKFYFVQQMTEIFLMIKTISTIFEYPILYRSIFTYLSFLYMDIDLTSVEVSQYLHKKNI